MTKRERAFALNEWHLGSMNDGLFIIDTPPRPSTDEVHHDRKDGPTMVLNVTSLPHEKAQAIVDAHNRALRRLLAATPAASSEVRETAAARDVLSERRRQIEAEGWTAEHDDKHLTGEMASAAASYAYSASLLPDPRQYLEVIGWFESVVLRRLWRWDRKWWKPTTARRDLVKAGALILAEIERLDRAALAAAKEDAR